MQRPLTWGVWGQACLLWHCAFSWAFGSEAWARLRHAAL